VHDEWWCVVTMTFSEERPKTSSSADPVARTYASTTDEIGRARES
jgi:hypothetical protein